MSSMITLPPKQAAEIIVVPFDFLSVLALGETITGAVVTCILVSGTDATPSAVISGTATVVGSIVSQKIQGGLTGNVYGLSCAAATSLGQALIIQGLVAVVNANEYI